MTTTKTLILAGLAAVSLGIGGARADGVSGGWGAAPGYYDASSSVVTSQTAPVHAPEAKARESLNTFWSQSGTANSPTAVYNATSRGD
jgi:hypothetical protein